MRQISKIHFTHKGEVLNIHISEPLDLINITILIKWSYNYLNITIFTNPLYHKQDQ